MDVMLAVSPKVHPLTAIDQQSKSGSWWYEIKFDGIRAVVTRSPDGQITIMNRRKRDITFRYPEVVEHWARVDFEGTLDGEIVCLDASGRPDFAAIHRRDAQQSPAGVRALLRSSPARFVPFDVIELAGADTRLLPYTDRHDLLVKTFGANAVSFASRDGEAMWRTAIDMGLEGLMAKQATSTYRKGRQPSWVKLKATKRGSVLVGGYTAGKGSRGAVGALELYLWDPEAGALVGVGSVGSGLKDSDTREVLRRLNAGEAVVIDVEYLEFSPGGRLRMPVFRGIRTDVDPADCLVNSLD